MKEQIPPAVKKERSAALSALRGTMRADVINEQINKRPVLPVLFETLENGYAYGHTPNFIELRVKSGENLHGEIRDVRLYDAGAETCEGALI